MIRQLAVAGLLIAGPSEAQTPDAGYRVGVVSESGDIVTWLRPVGDSLVVDHVVPVGLMPVDIDGPHNLAVAPDQRSYYVTIAHGTPYGALWRLDAASDTLLGRSQVELFPTTIGITPDGQFAFVANSDFHGDHPRTNVVSVVHTPTMRRLTDLDACDMPHGVKPNHAGNRVYVSCMHSDEILEISVGTVRITRRAPAGAGHVATSHPEAASAMPPCTPTFVSLSPDDRRLYVACNTRNTLQVWDAATLSLIGELSVGKGAYNVEPSPDGTIVVVTNKKEQSVSLVDIRSFTEIARVPTSKPIVHGIAYSPDGRLAYISCESIGTDPGSIDVIDLRSHSRVASVSIPGQPTGIAILVPRSTNPEH
jgi:DNA-binding beta-propeller fold protein YncE